MSFFSKPIRDLANQLGFVKGQEVFKALYHTLDSPRHVAVDSRNTQSFLDVTLTSNVVVIMTMLVVDNEMITVSFIGSNIELPSASP